MKNVFSTRVVPALAILASVLLASCNGQKTPTLTVFAAASFAHVLEDEKALIEQKSGLRFAIVSAASSTLARQIEEGAPAGVFITADKAWMDYLNGNGRLHGDPREVARNRLVLAFRSGAEGYCPARFIVPPTAADFLGACPYSGKVATGDPASVPLGKYAEEAIDFYGWKLDLAPAADARAALALLESGAVDAGLLYQTDVKADKIPFATYPVPGKGHAPIVYWGAAVAGGDVEKAEKFLAFLKSEGFTTILKDRGFEAGS